jgi:hypothetical protein
VTGDHVARFSESHSARVARREGGCSLAALAALAPARLVDDLTNDFLLADHPELQQFEG